MNLLFLSVSCMISIPIVQGSCISSDDKGKCAYNGDSEKCKKDDPTVLDKTRTVTKRICQKWNTNTPHYSFYKQFTDNKCRNNDANGPWCYTEDPDKKWEYCLRTCGEDHSAEYVAPTTAEVCAANPCKNGGTCTAVGGKVCCKCAPGFGGVECEISFENDECKDTYSSSCADTMTVRQNNCIWEGEDGGKNYCGSAWIDTFCRKTCKRCNERTAAQTDIDNAITKTQKFCPCLNGGIVTENAAASSGHHIGLTCVCPKGFFGEICELKFDGSQKEASNKEEGPCKYAKDICENGGTVQSRQKGYNYCYCNPTWYGTKCEIEGGKLRESIVLSESDTKIWTDKINQLRSSLAKGVKPDPYGYELFKESVLTQPAANMNIAVASKELEDVARTTAETCAYPHPQISGALGGGSETGGVYKYSPNQWTTMDRTNSSLMKSIATGNIEGLFYEQISLVTTEKDGVISYADAFSKEGSGAICYKNEKNGKKVVTVHDSIADCQAKCDKSAGDCDWRSTRGHYVQMAAGHLLKYGCGMANCERVRDVKTKELWPKSNYLVIYCRWVKMSEPAAVGFYKKGAACSKCPAEFPDCDQSRGLCVPKV